MNIKVKIKSIFFQIICASLILSFLFEICFASTQRFPISHYQPTELMREASIIVTMKNYEQFEITNISITETHLIGIIIPSTYNRNVKTKEILKIVKLEDIAYVQLKKTTNIAAPTVTGVCVGIMVGIGIIGLTILIVCAIASSN